MVDKTCTVRPNGTEECTLVYDNGWPGKQPTYYPPEAASGGDNTIANILLGVVSIIFLIGLLALIFGERPLAAPIPKEPPPRSMPLPGAGVPIS